MKGVVQAVQALYHQVRGIPDIFYELIKVEAHSHSVSRLSNSRFTLASNFHHFIAPSLHHLPTRSPNLQRFLSKLSLLILHHIIAMEGVSSNPIPDMSPQQIQQDIATLQTTLTDLVEDMKGLKADIIDVDGVPSAIKLQRRFTAYSGMVRECVANCQKLTAIFQSLSGVLQLSNEERTELEDLRRENQLLRQGQITAVQQSVDSAFSTIQQQLRQIEAGMERLLHTTGSRPTNPMQAEPTRKSPRINQELDDRDVISLNEAISPPAPSQPPQGRD